MRNRIIDEMEQISEESKSTLDFADVRNDPKYLTQFILDCSSLNLPTRFNMYDENLSRVFKLSRDLCHHIKKSRAEKLRNIQD